MGVEHLSEREAVFGRADLLAAALAHGPGTSIGIAEAEREVAALEKAGTAAWREHPRRRGLARHRPDGRR